MRSHYRIFIAIAFLFGTSLFSTTLRAQASKESTAEKKPFSLFKKKDADTQTEEAREKEALKVAHKDAKSEVKASKKERKAAEAKERAARARAEALKAEKRAQRAEGKAVKAEDKALKTRSKTEAKKNKAH